jgi:oxygen-independent coproporphyrinogen III oxidase
MRPLGLYIHFPYCGRRCPYCDFAVSVVEAIPHRAYADAVLAELRMRLRGGAWSERAVASVYLGGGTPSLWAPAELGRVLDGIAAALPVAGDAEITVEVNPGAAESASLPELFAAGANRVSFGTQSFDPRHLHALGRRHTAEESASAVGRARAAGFENVSIDLIYGVPGQTVEDAARDVACAAATGADHVSAYSLTLHPGVPMEKDARAGRIRLPDEDAADAIETAVVAGLQAAGYPRYEISNYAPTDRRAVHNGGYWVGREYLALGASSHGFRLVSGPAAAEPAAASGGLRYHNLSSAERYLATMAEGADPTAKSEHLGADTLLQERLFLGLRLTDGVDLSALAAWCGIDPADRYGAVLAGLEAEGLVCREGLRVHPTERGLRFADSVAQRFF